MGKFGDVDERYPLEGGDLMAKFWIFIELEGDDGLTKEIVKENFDPLLDDGQVKYYIAIGEVK